MFCRSLPEPENREFALDTYDELVAKARELHDRLKGTNSARRLCNSVERLLSHSVPGSMTYVPAYCCHDPGASKPTRSVR